MRQYGRHYGILRSDVLTTSECLVLCRWFVFIDGIAKGSRRVELMHHLTVRLLFSACKTCLQASINAKPHIQENPSLVL